MFGKIKHIKEEIHVTLWALARKSPMFVQRDVAAQYAYACEWVAGWEEVQARLAESRVLTSDFNVAIIEEIEKGTEEVNACLRYFDYFGLDPNELLFESD